MNTNSAFIASYTENPFWYQHLDLRQIELLRSGQPNVDFDAATKCRLYVSTMKAFIFQDDLPSIPVHKIKDHCVLVSDLTSMQNATENCLSPEPLRLELNFTYLWSTLLKSVYWENECLRLQLTGLVLLEKSLKWIRFLSCK